VRAVCVCVCVCVCAGVVLCVCVELCVCDVLYPWRFTGSKFPLCRTFWDLLCSRANNANNSANNTANNAANTVLRGVAFCSRC